MKKFWGRGESGVSNEMTQMHDMSVFRPIKKSSLTKDKKDKSACFANAPKRETRSVRKGVHVR
jgi:hypothetical protein